MAITRLPFRGEADIPRILDLVDSMPLSCPHVIDLPWRLSSPSINEGRDAAFWHDSSGRVVGFAAWQYSWAALDFFILPGPQQPDVEVALFAWANERFRERDEERGQPFPYWVEFQDDDQARRQLVEERGFLYDEDDRCVLLQHSLADLAPVPKPPAGFRLRPLAGAQEAAAYAEVHRAAFESTSMTPEWRARTIRMPQYRSELDLVVTAPNGSLAGFCIGWLAPERRVAQIEPIGVHPRFQRLGLGHVLLLEMLQRFKAHGASSAIIEPYIDNVPIRRACEAVGFQQAHTIRSKGKWLTQPIAMK
ncbi:MAG: GNAT family N-acetyltransferase [Chloroflexota bacterium]|nr:GNAT family N-acetyltransferase [Chloroflexota bacterium]